MSQSTPAADPLFLAFQLALAGRYSIDRELGRGGMGVVYLAREVHLDRLVAIKLLPPERAALPGLKERFLREARLAAKLSHPNITPIHAVAESDGFVYFVMAYVDGVTLTERVQARGPLSSSDGTRVLREAAWALAYAHGQGLVHRDVKPDNILLEGITGRVLVVDFGIAAAAGDAVEVGISGTPDFMSPEQALGGVIDARSDLYGLGVTAFYAFSGQLPFTGSSATELLAKQVTETPPSLGSLGFPVPRKVVQLVDRCLAKDPEERPASAQVVAEQLGVALEQRRELPLPLRDFAKRTGRINGGGTLFYFIGLYAATAVASIFIGTFWGLGTFLVGAAIGPFLYLVLTAARLRLRGYAHADLAPAFTREIEVGREERGGSAIPSRTEQVLQRLAKWSWTSAGLSILALITLRAIGTPMAAAAVSTVVWVLSISGMIGGPTVLGFVGLRQRRTDIDAEFWSGVWTGKIGRFVFSIARHLVGKRAIGPAMTHRATELSLGMAAEQLYESLPKATRQSLGELPQVLHRLQGDAQKLRAKYDALQDVLSEAGDSDEQEELRAERDVIHARLGEAVGALETIRLNLLRLHAGSLTVEGLTTHLGFAAEVSEEVERLIAAHDEVERGLKFPRKLSSTPV
ncbi:MAG: protein kinase [Gemmatimonadales bacterium]